MAIDEANSGLLEDAEELDLGAIKEAHEDPDWYKYPMALPEENDCADCAITYSDDDITEPDATPIYTNETPSKWALKGRLRSWALWVSVLGAIGIILDNLGVFEKIGLDGERWTVLVNAIGGILVAFGIFNDPTNRDGF